MNEFNLSQKSFEDINIIELKGYLDAHTAPRLEEAISNLVNNNQCKIVVNFSELNYISSAGLGVFMAFIETVRSKGGDIKFTAMNDKIYNIFDLIGFPKIYEFYKTDEEAIQRFKLSEK
ncbi:MAG: STAS domain-containing protein [Ignavibacteria bacterium]